MRRGGRWLRLILVAGVIVSIGIYCFPPVHSDYRRARHGSCRNHLKQIALALHNYHDVYGCFPPAYVADAEGKPMHSWRVLLLPYLYKADLYERYKFDEPWDGPNNRKLHSEAIVDYACPSESDASEGFTSYLAVTGEHTMWHANQGVPISAVTDAHDSTIILVEVANSGIHWMEPTDLPLSAVARSATHWPRIGKRARHEHDTFMGRSDLYEHAAVLQRDAKTLRILHSASIADLIGLFTIDGGEDTTSFFEEHTTSDR